MLFNNRPGKYDVWKWHDRSLKPACRRLVTIGTPSNRAPPTQISSIVTSIYRQQYYAFAALKAIIEAQLRNCSRCFEDIITDIFKRISGIALRIIYVIGGATAHAVILEPEPS